MKACLWCEKELIGRQLRFCCSAHSMAYYRADGQKPSPKYCIHCNKQLTGLQRLYCCDAHRKAYKRAQAKKQK